MNPKLRLLLYVLLVGCMASFAVGYVRTYRSTDGPEAGGLGATNVGLVTNLVVSTNAAGVEQTNVHVAAAPEAPEETKARRSSPRMGRLMAFAVAMFFTLVGLSILVGHDISKFFANRVEEFIFNDNLEG